VSQRLSVLRQLANLEAAWPLGETVDGSDVAGLIAEDAVAGPLREELLSSIVLRDLLDHDLEHRVVSTPKGSERRQVGQRIQISRDLVRVADCAGWKRDEPVEAAWRR
jgi:hypothetical protein